MENKKTLQDLNLGIDKNENGVKAFNYKYNNLPVILPYLAKQDFKYSLKQYKVDLISETKIEKGNGKVEWKVTLKVYYKMKFNDEPEELIEQIGIGTNNDADKANGSAQTYARRYALIGYFNLSDGGEYDPEQKDTKVKDIKTSNQTKKVKPTNDETFDFVEEPKPTVAKEDKEYIDDLFA